jgi:hypothetical protein
MMIDGPFIRSSVNVISSFIWDARNEFKHDMHINDAKNINAIFISLLIF